MMNTFFEIAIINPNNVTFTNDEILSINNDILKNRIEQYIEFRTVTPDTMMIEIVDTIKLNTSQMGSTTLCKEDENYVYQLCHLDPPENNDTNNNINNNNNNINNVASHLAMGNNTNIYGSCVMICSKIKDTGLCETHTISMDDIVNILYHKLTHKCVKINCDNSVEEIVFINDPIENMNINANVNQNFQWMELPLIKFNLIVFIQTNPLQDTINKKATKLVGTHKIHGDILVAAKSSEDEYIDMDIQLFEKLLILSSGPLIKRVLTDDEKKDGERIDGLPIVQNKYHILNERLKKHIYCCDFCNEPYNNDTQKNSCICTGCYRVVYHDKNCQKNDWLNHKVECLYNKEPIHKSLTIK